MLCVLLRKIHNEMSNFLRYPEMRSPKERRVRVGKWRLSREASFVALCVVLFEIRYGLRRCGEFRNGG